MTARGNRLLIRPVLAAVLICFATTASAQLSPTPLRGDSRLVQHIFDADNTYLVLTKPKAVTHLQFGADELIQSVAAGDTANWELTPTKNRKNLFIKPKFDDMTTSMTVLTDRRTYQFVLQSTGEGRKWYQRVSWVYGESLLTLDGTASDGSEAPGPEKRAATAEPGRTQANQMPAGLQAENLRFNYEISGDAPFRPLVVFDDGRFTYFKLATSLQEMPALFAVIEGNDYSLVNFEIKGDYLVAQRLLEHAVLKLGKAEVKVQRSTGRRGLFGIRIEN